MNTSLVAKVRPRGRCQVGLLLALPLALGATAGMAGAGHGSHGGGHVGHGGGHVGHGGGHHGGVLHHVPHHSGHGFVGWGIGFRPHYGYGCDPSAPYYGPYDGPYYTPGYCYPYRPGSAVLYALPPAGAVAAVRVPLLPSAEAPDALPGEPPQAAPEGNEPSRAGPGTRKPLSAP